MKTTIEMHEFYILCKLIFKVNRKETIINELISIRLMDFFINAEDVQVKVNFVEFNGLELAKTKNMQVCIRVLQKKKKIAKLLEVNKMEKIHKAQEKVKKQIKKKFWLRKRRGF